MNQIMLIDAEHPEELRVAVLENGTLSEFDYESTLKKQNKGNIYLAKVTRVEPSLQAAFVEYGQNRQGFLSFSEIHPDYFRIPIADRKHLIAEESLPVPEEGDEDEEAPTTIHGEDHDAPLDDSDIFEGEGEFQPITLDEDDASETIPMDLGVSGKSAAGTEREEDEWKRHRRLKRQYTIQEVIKKNQILLVQVVKEERGNKGAALTTYLSLAGRYCVLMPNSGSGGGISRKIGSHEDRKRIRGILDELEVPESISVIVRTAGMGRTKTEIKRDYDYLLRVWGQIREDTLSAVAPSLIYEEGQLIRRAIRDIYDRDTEEVWVSGEEAYKEAKAFMKMLMPSHSKRVKLYKDKVIPLFHRHHVEPQIEAVFKPITQLPSGGYLVFGQTEALVSIDVNSGRSTRERSVEDMALNTNLEAAEEIARQLRLRDLAGLVVVDFIDMEDNRKNLAVERRLKDLLRKDRARIQVGRISQFGLLEMSRQRLRPSIEEISSHICPHCQGTGRLRSVESLALALLRAVEYEGLKQNAFLLRLTVPHGLAVHLFNEKRSEITDIERLYAMRIRIEESTSVPDNGYQIDVLEKKPEGHHLPENLEVLQAFQKELTERQRKKSSHRRDRNKSEEGERDKGRDRDRDKDRDRDRDRRRDRIRPVVAEGEEGQEVPSPDTEGTESPFPSRRRRNRGNRRGRGQDRGQQPRATFTENPDNQSEPQAISEGETDGAGVGVSQSQPSAEGPRDDNKRRRRNRYRNRRRGRSFGEGNATEGASSSGAQPSGESPASSSVEGNESKDKKEKPSWWEKIVGAE
ncbi:MAG: ribonuclease E/G [Alphaproteobacteria bacterium]